MRGCISMSLYGNDAKYVCGAIENAKLAPKIYPGWTLVIHAERDHYAIPKLRLYGAEVVEHEPLPGSGGMFWRFTSIDDPRFTHTVVRDADSRLNVRGKAAVDSWLESGKSLHVIRDNPWHLNLPIIGGAWGMANTTDFSVSDAIAKWSHNHQYGDDEAFLGREIWPRFYDKGDFLRHCFEPNSPDDRPFPSHAPYGGFVCEQIAPTFDEKFKAVVLSPEHYMNRRERFFTSLGSHGGFLRDSVVWHRGKTLKERLVPSHVDHADEYPHYYLASRDHIDILEEALLDGTEFLFVFEDDAVFLPYFEEFLLRAWAALPPDWYALMLGGQPQTDHQRSVLGPNSAQAIARVSGCLGMHGVLWNRAGMRRAFDHFTFWNRMTIDQAFRGLQGDEPNFYGTARWVVDIDSEAEQFGKDK